MTPAAQERPKKYIHANEVGYRDKSQPGEKFGTVYDIIANVVPFASAVVPIVRGRDFWHYEKTKKGQNNTEYGALRIPKAANANGDTPIYENERSQYVIEFFENWVDKVNRVARTEDHERRRDRVTRGAIVNGLTAVGFLGATFLFKDQAQHIIEQIPDVTLALVNLIPHAEGAAEVTKNATQVLVNKEIDISLAGGILGTVAFGALGGFKTIHRDIEKTELDFIAQKSGTVDENGSYHEPKFLIPQIQETMAYVGVPEEQRVSTQESILAMRPIRRKAFEVMEDKSKKVKERRRRGNVITNYVLPFLNPKVEMTQIQDAKNAAKELEKVEYAIDYKLNTWSLGYRALQLLQGNINLQWKRDRIYNKWAYGYVDPTPEKQNGEYVRGYHKTRNPNILQ